MIIILALLRIFMLFAAVFCFTWSLLTSVTHTHLLLLLVTLTLYTLMYVYRPWLLTLLCYLKCLLKTVLHPPEIRLNRITPCYVTFLLPATSVVCAQHFVDPVVASFIAVIHNATSKIICPLVFYRLQILHL